MSENFLIKKLSDFILDNPYSFRSSRRPEDVFSLLHTPPSSHQIKDSFESWSKSLCFQAKSRPYSDKREASHLRNPLSKVPTPSATDLLPENISLTPQFLKSYSAFLSEAKPHRATRSHTKTLDGATTYSSAVVENILLQMYTTWDEDLLYLLIDSLDEYTNYKSQDEKHKRLSRLMGEIVEAIGLEHVQLLESIFTHASKVLLSLLLDFVRIDIYSEKTPSKPLHDSFDRLKHTTQRRHGKKLFEDQLYQHLVTKAQKLKKETEREASFFFFAPGTTNATNQTRKISYGKKHICFNIVPPCSYNSSSLQRLSISESLPPWTHSVFGTITHLNAIQSAVFSTSFHTDNNMLICAPTGAGKTLIALLVMLREIDQRRKNGVISTNFKIVYTAPMKALASEITGKISQWLETYDIVVRELTGDTQLTRKQISETQIFVATPEKWDIITRKTLDPAFLDQHCLLILDEVHLLNDERGPVLEAIVARTLRLQDQGHLKTRLVALSATIPNPSDVARFLHVDPAQGLYVFGPAYRPVPLETSYIGITSSTTQERLNEMNEVTYTYVEQALQQNRPVMVFVHSRLRTFSMARQLRDTLSKRNYISLVPEDHKERRDILKRIKQLHTRELGNLIVYGIGTHHAGLPRQDRETIEYLFRQKALAILVCTATLAWGVNLPAHTVIIHGTEIYDPQKGGYVQLSALDITQIFGRAGRPQYDTSGHAILITGVKEVHNYLRVFNHALPIESKLIQNLPDHVNAEIHAGTLNSLSEGIRWLEYTYLWQRLQRNPMYYGVTIPELRRDPQLRAYRYQLLMDASKQLSRSQMICFCEETGSLEGRSIGRIASHFYLSYISVEKFLDLLSVTRKHPDKRVEEGELFNAIACSTEFSTIRVRNEEEEDLRKAEEQLPSLIRGIRMRHESVDQTSSPWKVCLLLKCFISRLTLTNPALRSDMAYIYQNTRRICRGLFEMETIRNRPETALRFLDLGKSLEKQCWKELDHPLRQFENSSLTHEVLQQLETKRPAISQLVEMSPEEIGDLLHSQRFGAQVKELAVSFPFVSIRVETRPLTCSLMSLGVEIRPRFHWRPKYHGTVELWWLVVLDEAYTHIFHQERVQIHERVVHQRRTQSTNFSIVADPSVTRYVVAMHSLNWVGAFAETFFTLTHLHLPEQDQPHTPLLKHQKLLVNALPAVLQTLFSFPRLNAIQSHCFQKCYHHDENLFIGAPTGSGKIVCAELAIMRVLERSPAPQMVKIIYIAPSKTLVRARLKNWIERFREHCGIQVLELTGDDTLDLTSFRKANILCTTPEKWEGLTRHWNSQPSLFPVSLMILDKIHVLGGGSRTRP